jgi:hypothetical protein
VFSFKFVMVLAHLLIILAITAYVPGVWAGVIFVAWLLLWTFLFRQRIAESLQRTMGNAISVDSLSKKDIWLLGFTFTLVVAVLAWVRWSRGLG